VTIVDCRCQTATTTTCVWKEQSVGHQTLSGFIRKPYQRSSVDHVSMCKFSVALSLAGNESTAFDIKQFNIIDL